MGTTADETRFAPRDGVTYVHRLSRFESRVREGEVVGAGDPIAARLVTLPLSVVDLVAELRKPTRSIVRSPGVAEGVHVKQGQLLASASGPLGLGRREAKAPISGTIRAVIPDDGVVVIRPDELLENVSAVVPGRVYRIGPGGIEIRSAGKVIASVASSGSMIWGSLAVLHPENSVSDSLQALASSSAINAPRIMCFGTPIDYQIVQLVRSAFNGPKPVAVIAPTMAYSEFQRVVTHASGTAVLLTEGFGSQANGYSMPSDIWQVLTAHEGELAGVVTASDGGPALLILAPCAPPETESSSAESLQGSSFAAGTAVRFLRKLRLESGTILDGPVRISTLPSGYRSSCIGLQFDDGTRGMMPLERLRS